ncbi:hypothetical protein GCM10008967_24780 [Bacillus carboniphilus]|uniref:Radical SAM protein n=1 Tax=Bacillus carboniphilus TaxID=86663 RepID=A0ABP3G604_9BACI
MKKYFKFDKRLGIDIPHLDKNWHQYAPHIQEDIIMHWEQTKGKIPDRIKSLEVCIDEKQNQLSEEDDFMKSCLLNEEISELASIINDLWIWYRTEGAVTNAKTKNT